MEQIISELQIKGQVKEPAKEWYNVRESADYLGVSVKTVRRLLQRKLLKRNLAVRKILIHYEELARYRDRVS